jgi:hypothetical protein
MTDKQPTPGAVNAAKAKALALLSEYLAWREAAGLEPNGRAYRLLLRCEKLAQKWGVMHR